MKFIQDDVAIIGMAGVFPECPDLATFWKSILAKKSCISDHPDPTTMAFLDPSADTFERVYSIRGGYLGDLARFDPIRYGIMPSDVAGGESDHFVALGAAGAAIEDAGLTLDDLPRERVEVILGHGSYFSSGNVNWFQHGVALEQCLSIVRQLMPHLTSAELDGIREALRSSLPAMTPQTPPTLIPNILAGRIANRLDLMGANYILDGACASAHLALSSAVNDLLTDRCDYVLAGAVQASCLVLELMLFCRMNALSRLSELRPFDERSDGTMLGEGAGILLLKRRKDAERDGDRIYAVIRGIGTASDGKARGLMAPRLEGQVLAIQRAYEDAGVDPATVELVEAHGTGIPLGDMTEIAALRQAFGPRRGAYPTCGVGSVKSMIGHCRPAAGIAGIIKAVLALHHKILPPTLHCDTPNPELHLEDSPFYIVTEPRPWIHPGGNGPRRAAVSSMGFGGIDAHCVLEEHVPS